MTKSITHLTLRLPESLKDKLRDHAEMQTRSLNKEITARLKDSLKLPFSRSIVSRINENHPTAEIDSTLGIRIPTQLKESCQQDAMTFGISLNQMILLRMHASFDSSTKPLKVSESAPISHEHQALMNAYDNLTPKHKQAVMTLIRNLS